ncbi:phytanoyl-CoA dioxygenase family protein [Actinacidiphila yeochonensis]|uniref:phytanoyl-CoA dioxygenase family protein n=1 Tax=Actinacidiphila yeochonensis TaxID=89050 RepID=UPI0007C6DB40|nr:phytanoyl-CoA dioxygenase family protein [Actinacidiphila yeochonensis]
MDYSLRKQAFDRDGYVVVRQFLSSSELTELADEIQRFIREVVPDLPETQVFYEVGSDGKRGVRQIHRMNCDPYFDSYQHHGKWIALATELVGEAVIARPPIYFSKPPNTDFPTPPHQDNCAFGLTPPNGVEMLLALEEPFDEETGCLRYLPGSHREGPRRHTYSGVRGFALEVADFGPRDEAREVAVEMRPGDLLCHHPLTVHRAHRNRSQDRTRAGFGMWFRGASTRVEAANTEDYDRSARRAQHAGR